MFWSSLLKSEFLVVAVQGFTHLSFDAHFAHVSGYGALGNGFVGFAKFPGYFRSAVILLRIIIYFLDFLFFIRSKVSRASNRDSTIRISILSFPLDQGANAYSEILGTFNLSEIRVFLTIVDSIQLELLSVLFSWYSAYLILVLYKHFQGNISFCFVLIRCWHYVNKALKKVQKIYR